jgi:hypothetical protein
MTEDYQFEVEGEVIKMIHDELPAVRWTCGNCKEDSATIFYEPTDESKIVTCDYCGTNHLVRKPL